MTAVQSIAETTRTWAEQRQFPVNFSLETGSTNDDAKRQAFLEPTERMLYLAAHQRSGRGRGANTWLDTGSGECLLSTWSYAVPSSPQAITAPRIGLALYHAARSVWPSLEWSLKAPNDLFLNGLKVGGLLVETVSSGEHFRLLIGLGLNVLNHPRRFDTADHLSDALNGAPSEGDWFQFLDGLQEEFQTAVTDALKSTLGESVRRELAQALNANTKRTLNVIDVSPDGDLLHASGRVRWTDL